MQQALKEQLLSEMSRRNIDLVTKYIEDNPEQLKDIVELVMGHADVIAFRASWVLEKLTERKNVNVNPIIPQIVSILNEIPLSGTRRTIAKVLMMVDIEEEEEGYVLEFCMNMLESPKEPVAVKANCMTIVFALIPKYPELKDEVLAVIEDQIPHHSIGFKSRYNVLKRKYKLI